MILEIKKVKKCRNGAYGNFLMRPNNTALITISLKKNAMLAEYGATLLHEMLHCYMTLLRREGFRVTNRNEHKWIEACEVVVIDTMKKILPRRK